MKVDNASSTSNYYTAAVDLPPDQQPSSGPTSPGTSTQVAPVNKPGHELVKVVKKDAKRLKSSLRKHVAQSKKEASKLWSETKTHVDDLLDKSVHR